MIDFDSLVGKQVQRQDLKSLGRVSEIVREHDCRWDKNNVWIMTTKGHRIFSGKVEKVTGDVVTLNSF